MVNLTIELSADTSERDTEFKAIPLGWAQFGEKTELKKFPEDRTLEVLFDS